MKLPGQSNRRSDEIRRRRTSQSHATRQASKSRKDRVVSPPLPPVMARTPATGVSTRPAGKKDRNSRRVYNVSLDAAHGAEMSLPALPRFALSWRILSVLIVGLLGYALYSLWESPSFRVDAPQVSGLTILNSSEVVSELGLTGKPVFLLNAQDIQAHLLKAFPELSNAEVEIEMPNTVLITVTERSPVLAWVQDGNNILVDAGGFTFPARGAAQSGAYPVIQASGDPPSIPQPKPQETELRDATISKITGGLLPPLPAQNEVRQLLAPEMVKAILLVSDQRPAGASLIYDPTHGLGWTDRRGWNVYLGDDVEIEVKLQVYRAIMDSLKSEDTRPQMISVEFVHAPYYRLEPLEQ